MSGYIHEFFGYQASDFSDIAQTQRASEQCPFLSQLCTKKLKDGVRAGVCAVRQITNPAPVICCPNRLYAEHHRILSIISHDCFEMELPLCPGNEAVATARVGNGATAVFGHGWAGELPLPTRDGSSFYYIDWILAHIDKSGHLVEITAAEVQTIDTTGSYAAARQVLKEKHEVIKSSVGLNWENVSKRILPQLIYKGQILQRERLCRKGLYFVCNEPVYTRVLQRLGGTENLPTFPQQPAAITFLAYDYDPSFTATDGILAPLDVRDKFCTTVYKIQEAFSSLTLPEQNVYETAILKALYG